MKRKIAAFLIFLTFVLGGFSLVVAAEDVYSENIRAINEGVYTLGEVMDGYAAADVTEGKTVAIQTNAVIVRYVNMINDLRADGRVSNEALSGDVDLLTLKGEVSGECAWVFAIHSVELSDEARERVRAVYESALDTVI